MARSSEHQRVQREGKKRDYGTCCVCGSKERPEGHHVIEYQYGGAATLDNIVTLCQKCHKQVHRGNIDIMKFYSKKAENKHRPTSEEIDLSFFQDLL